jgi:predicted metal-binding membrane protein
MQRHIAFCSRALRPRPTAAFELLIAISWMAVVSWSLLAGGSIAEVSRPQSLSASSMPGMAMLGVRMTAHASIASALVGGLPMWVLMVVAMMLPGALPALAHVAAHSYRWRRGRAMTAFSVAFIALWVMAGTVALAVLSLVHANLSLELFVMFGAAAVWQLSVFKDRALRDCHRSLPLPLTGWAATVGAMRFGAANAGACLRSCWPAMAAMAIVPGWEMWLWMPLLTGLMSWEKLAGRPRLTTRVAAVALTLAAASAAAFG